MKPFDKSIVGSFKMPEEKATVSNREKTTEEVCRDIQKRMAKAMRANDAHVRARIYRASEAEQRGMHERIQDAERAARAILMAACDGHVREGAKTHTDSETMKPYTTFMWRANTPVQLEAIFDDFVRCMRVVISSIKEEGKSLPAPRKMTCKVRTWPTISNHDKGYSLYFRAAFYPVYDNETWRKH